MAKFNFIKGHMGGNEIVLLIDRGSLRKNEMIDYGMQVLKRPHVGGHQLGFLKAVNSGKKLRARIVDVTEEDFLPICGGLTQVLGKAMRETETGRLLGYTGERENIRLIMDGGTVLISSRDSDQGFEVWSALDPVLESIYEKGVERINLSEVSSVRVGENLAINGKELRKRYPSLDLEDFDDHTRSVIVELQDQFLQETLGGRRDVCTLPIYDFNPERGGDARIIFPNHIPTEHVEPACGTGSLLAAAAMLEEESIPTDKDKLELRLEAGGSANSIGGPEITRLKLSLESRRISSATFSHNAVHLLAKGELRTKQNPRR